jgi:hypothetical protein
MSASGTSNFPFVFRVVDIIPHDDSIESNQNSEPSIAVNPVNPMQMFAGSFGPEGSPQNHNPFFLSTDGAPPGRASARSTTMTNRSDGKPTARRSW